MKKIISSIFILFAFSSIFAATFFSGYAGGKLEYTSSTETKKDETLYDPNLQLQAFFAGQFNFTQNLWGRMEFSINTQDFINQSLFSSTDSSFQIDEVSLTVRKLNENKANYFSAYMGTFEPIGSDIFLQRYFSCEKIASELTNSWLGLAGSILYPHFGIGIADNIRFYAQPITLGGYIYVNHENKQFYVLNADVRTACNYRFFTCDFAAGIDAPLGNKLNGMDYFIAIQKIYWHTGTTMLIGNNYTQSLFLQVGIFNVSSQKNTEDKTELLVDSNKIYLLLEPRFIIKNIHFNISLYSLPRETVSDLLYIDDPLGFNLNFYTEALKMNGTPFKLGCHASLSFKDTNLFDLFDKGEDESMTFGTNFANLFAAETPSFNVNLTPYFSTQILSGELNALLKIKIMTFVDENSKWYEAFDVNIGYKCRF